MSAFFSFEQNSNVGILLSASELHRFAHFRIVSASKPHSLKRDTFFLRKATLIELFFHKILFASSPMAALAVYSRVRAGGVLSIAPRTEQMG